MKKVLLECRTGGRCYTEQLDGTNCDWGTVLVWQPPQRFTMAWRITDRWEFESDITRASEVEVTFTPQGDGSTRVDIEHRNFERTVGGGDAMRATVDSPTGWSGLLGLFVAHAEQSDETGSA
jgi:uncharacterized protein YndB with AHSA1/START domain